MKSERRIAVLLALSAAAFWVAEPVMVKFMNLDLLDPWSIMGLRSFLSAPLTAVWMRYDQGCWPSVKKSGIGRTLLVAGLLMLLSNIFWVLCVVMTTVSNAVVLYHTAPIFAAVIGWLLLGEKLTRNDVGALLAAACGVIYILLAGPPTGKWSGEIFALLCGLDFAAYLIFLRRIERESDKFTVLFIGHLGCCPLLFFGGTGIQQLALISAWDWALLAGLGVLATAAFVCLSKATKVLPGYEVALWILAEPVLGVMLGFVILSEEPKPFMVAGAVMLLLAMFIEARKNGKGDAA